jgi:phage shock protein E
MKRLMLLALAAVPVVVVTLGAGPAVSEETAREQLKKGALLVDVRTVQEFQTRHLTNAVNIPLGEIKETLPSRVPNKDQSLLLYCRTGRRSGIAEQELRGIGYTNVFNLGSYEQAEKIVNGKAP